MLIMNVKRMSLGPLGTNCYLVYEKEEVLIIDPGGDPDAIISFVSGEKLRPQAILLTHAHFDHIGAVDVIRNYYDVDVYIHEDEEDWLEDASLNGSFQFMGKEITTPKAERLLTPGILQLASLTFEVLHTPGHSPGSVSF